jgi:hypothetical protein
MRVRGAGVGPNVRSKEMGDDAACWLRSAAKGPSMALVRVGPSLITVTAPTSEDVSLFAKAAVAAVKSIQGRE